MAGTVDENVKEPTSGAKLEINEKLMTDEKANEFIGYPDEKISNGEYSVFVEDIKMLKLINLIL